MSAPARSRVAGAIRMPDVHGFERNLAWFDAHADEIYARRRGKGVCIAGQELDVWQWCADWDKGYYKISPKVGPQGQTTGTHRIVSDRGWYQTGIDCCSARHTCVEPGAKVHNIGFRVVAVPAKR